MNNKDNKMNCTLCRNMIDDYLDGRLQEKERLSIEEHINSCSDCSELLMIQELSEKVIRSEKSLTPGYFLSSRIMSEIESIEDQKESSIVRILRPALATISVAAAIFAGVIVGNISASPSDYPAPIEFTLMNDSEIEFLEVLTLD